MINTFLRKSCTVHHQLISFVVILSKSCTVHHQLISFVVILSKSRTVHCPLISFIVILSKSRTVPHPLFFHRDSQQVLHHSSSAQSSTVIPAKYHMAILLPSQPLFCIFLVLALL
jgi:hypothetical protein